MTGDFFIWGLGVCCTKERAFWFFVVFFLYLIFTQQAPLLVVVVPFSFDSSSSFQRAIYRSSCASAFNRNAEVPFAICRLMPPSELPSGTKEQGYCNQHRRGQLFAVLWHRGRAGSHLPGYQNQLTRPGCMLSSSTGK